MRGRSWIGAVAFVAVVGVALLSLSLLARGKFHWGNPEKPKAQCEALDPATLTPSSGGLVPSYGVDIANAIVREPQNTWSNLAFVFVGALIWRRDHRFFARLLACALVGLGLASGLYHASLLPHLRTVDVATMGWVSFALGCVGFEAVTWKADQGTRRKFWQTFAGLAGSASAIATGIFRNDVRIAGFKPFDSTYTTVAGISGIFLLVAICLVQASLHRPASSYPTGRIAMLAVLVASAAFLQINDRPGRLCCSPENVIQAHAIWHVLMAAAALMAYDLFQVFAGRPSLFSTDAR